MTPSSWKQVGGRELRSATSVLEITDHCPRCVMTTLPQGDLPRTADPAHSGTPQRSPRRRLCRGASRRESPARRHRNPRLSTNRAIDISRETPFALTNCRHCHLRVGWAPQRLAPPRPHADDVVATLVHRALRRAGFDEVYPARPRAAAVDWSKPVSAGRANASGCVTSSGED